MTSAADLLEVGRASLRALARELAHYRVVVDPALELRQGEGLLCYYDRTDGNIYLSTPDPDEPRGQFELLLLRALIGVDTNQELMRLLELLVPWLVAHEVGHHLCHKYDCRRANDWEEERIANELAGAFVRSNLRPGDKQELQVRLAGGLKYLRDGLEKEDSLADTQAQDIVGYVFLHMQMFYADLTANHELAIDGFVRTYLPAFVHERGGGIQSG